MNRTPSAVSDGFVFALLFKDRRNSTELTPAIWAALQEVEALYTRLARAPRFARICLVEEDGKAAAESVTILNHELWKAIWAGARSPRARSLDQEKLARSVRPLLGPHAETANLILVTDQEITPPPEWRYILWDGWERDSIVSLAAMDPVYWGEVDDERSVTLKRRARAACCSAVGEVMGLERCHNPKCFLYAAVDSVLRLDDMEFIGAEHELAPLTGVGFLPARTFMFFRGAPTAVQPVGPVTTSPEPA